MNRKAFKDFLIEDLNVFFNELEFAEYHDWHGEKVLMIISENNHENSSGLAKEHSLVTKDVFYSDKTVYLKVGTIRKPRNGVRINLNGVEHYVVKSNIQSGVLSIELRINEV